jgi:hypothetical protein
MHDIPDDKEFKQCRAAGDGYILNEDVITKTYKLHHASCCWLDLADGHRHSKFWAPEHELNEAIVWLIHRRQDHWRVCKMCLLRPESRS